jgi:chemotaxis response regulator CheB
MNIGIVNDVPMMLEGLRRIVTDGGHHVLWVAADGESAIRHAGRRKADVILMDMIMPGIDGVEATRQIMLSAPCPILVVTSSVSDNVAYVFNAMSAGALDAVDTPCFDGGDDDGKELLRKLNQLEALIPGRVLDFKTPAARQAEAILAKTELPVLVAIGASSGGPGALAKFLKQPPQSDRAAFVIAQHVDIRFARRFAQWLDEQVPLPVVVVDEGTAIKPGHVYVAATENHVILRCDRKLGYSAMPQHLPYRPSVDVFFSSVAQQWTGLACAILFSGMGDDGAQGMANMQARGFLTMAQSEASCAVFGMPKAAIERGAVDKILDPEQMAAGVNQYINKQIGPKGQAKTDVG